TVFAGSGSPAPSSPTTVTAFARTDTGSKRRNQVGSDARGDTWAGVASRGLATIASWRGRPWLAARYTAPLTHPSYFLPSRSYPTKPRSSSRAVRPLVCTRTRVHRCDGERPKRAGACRRRCSATLCRRDLGASSRRVLLDRKVLRGLSVKLVPLNKAAQCPKRVGE